jgi:hypothetical protein
VTASYVPTMEDRVSWTDKEATSTCTYLEFGGFTITRLEDRRTLISDVDGAHVIHCLDFRLGWKAGT